MNTDPSPVNRRDFITSSGLAALSATACTVLPRGASAGSPRDDERGGGRDTDSVAKGGPVLRYYIPPENREEHLAELIHTCKRTGIQEVSLFTTEYLGTSQFKDIEELEQVCAHLALCAERLKAAGLVFHLNAFHTLGHLYAPQPEVEKFGFQRQLQADGKAGAHPVLDPSCPRLRGYLQQAYRLYGGLQPELLFVDDDYTVKFTQCFVPGRVARFAARFGCATDPKAIDALLTKGDRAARSLMSELITDDLVSLATAIREAVHEVSPNTRLGHMHAGAVNHDVPRVARALAGEKRSCVRPQIPLYREDVPLADYPERFWGLDSWKARLPEDFELFPECENYPYDPALKSPVAAYAHHAYILSVGEPRVALSLNAAFGGKVPASESRSLVDYFAERKGQLLAVEKLLQGATEPLGVGVWQDPEMQKLGLLRRPSLKALQSRGVPVCCERTPESATIHWGDSLQHLDDAGLDRVLQRGGFLDLRAVQTLQKRGRLEEIGFMLGERCAAADVMHLPYDRNDGGVELWPYYYFVGRLPGREHLPFRVNAPSGKVLASYLDEQRRVSVPHLLTWTSPAGARFALLNASTDGATGESLLSRWSAPLLARAVEWVQDRSLPAQTASEGAFLLKALRLGAGEAMLLTLWNLSTASAAAATLRLAPDLAAWKWARIQTDGNEQPLKVHSINGAPCIVQEHPLPSLDCSFLVARRTGGMATRERKSSR